MKPVKTIGIIGSGKLARSLLVNPVEGYELAWVYKRRSKKSNEFAKFLADSECQVRDIFTNIKKIYLTDIIFIAVSDNTIKDISDSISIQFGDNLEGKHIIHFSGINTIDILDACRQKGAFVHKMHPYQTFYYPEPGVFNGIFWGVQSSANPEIIEDYIVKSGGNVLDLNMMDDIDHVKYHASAVVASNFTNIVIAYSKKIIDTLGISSDIIKPIIQRTVINAFRGNEFPLTGPIARGDAYTVSKHLEALSYDPLLIKFYKDISASAIALCTAKESPVEKEINEIRELLEKL